LAAVEAVLRTVHRRYLGLACFGTILSQGGARKDYIKGLSEVSYLALVLAAKGLENPSSVLLRQSIELVLKHVYFATHPVEFSWSSTRESYREITFQSLLEYMRKTDESARFPDSEMLLVELERQYHVLSRFVHMHSRMFIPYTSSRIVTAANPATLDAFQHRCLQLWPLLIALLLAHFPAKFIAANSNEKALIARSLGTPWHNRAKTFLRSLTV
jgi:hypothetical protein